MTRLGTLATLLLVLAGCQHREEVTTTTGRITIECDEAIMPAMQALVDDFHRSYRESEITLVSVGAREAIVNFINDSIRVIATARPFNEEEEDVLEEIEVEYRSYKVALDGVAVILNRQNPRARMQTTELDSILVGKKRVWHAMRRPTPVRIALCDPNSSTNEIVRTIVLGGADFSAEAVYLDSSTQVMGFVAANEGAIGIVGNAWLFGKESEYTVVRLHDPEAPADSADGPGMYYAPAQAYIYTGSYPLSTEVYMYNRELLRTVGLGFIAYANNIAGQRIFQAAGLVPATMPVRLVRTTSKRVDEQ